MLCAYWALWTERIIPRLNIVCCVLSAAYCALWTETDIRSHCLLRTVYFALCEKGLVCWFWCCVSILCEYEGPFSVVSEPISH